MTDCPEEVGLSGDRLARVDAWREAQVRDGRLAGATTLVMRRGRVAHLGCSGLADIARGVPMAPDSILRIYSMTKPLTSVAIMMLYEEGRFQLDDPVTRFLPCFRDMRVFTTGSRGSYETVPAERDITFRDLLTHTSGLTYGMMHANMVDALYRERGVDFQTSDRSLGEVVETAASLPLLAQPGREWNYSIATDVLGHLVAVI
ncbi:serine hydrolase domain-containing protein, partial [Roseomonas sp. DSM 102946]|nr:serine hydrolase domain-containing protein [Roseomonas sp. DSM 102946]